MSDQDVDRPTTAVPDASHEAAQLAWVALQRYVGWLGHDFSAKRVREAVAALGVALDHGGGPDARAAAIASVTFQVEQLSAFALRPLFRKALQDLRRALDSPTGER